MWDIRNIERITEKALIEELGGSNGQQRFAQYLDARRILVEDVLEEIKRTQQGLTDHGPKHIQDVLDKAEELLGSEENIRKNLRGTDLYCLILSILFHDVGNIYDRREHQRRISQVYDHVRQQHSEKTEKLIVLTAVEAHCGETADGSKDTLKDVPETSHLCGRQVKLRTIASVLRLSDELAEGRQRTSIFMQQIKGYPSDSEIYHEYSKITTVFVDRSNERITLTYNIELNTEAGKFDGDKEKYYKALIEFTYGRIMKLNQERQYVRHYCDILSVFKKTTVAFNFWINGELADLGLMEAKLTDVVIPGEHHKDFSNYHSCYAIPNLMERIKKRMDDL